MTREIDSPTLVDTKYAAAYLKKSVWTIHRWCNDRKIPAVKVGRTWYIRLDRLEQMFDPMFKTPDS